MYQPSEKAAQFSTLRKLYLLLEGKEGMLLFFFFSSKSVFTASHLDLKSTWNECLRMVWGRGQRAFLFLYWCLLGRPQLLKWCIYHKWKYRMCQKSDGVCIVLSLTSLFFFKLATLPAFLPTSHSFNYYTFIISLEIPFIELKNVYSEV